MPTGTSRYGGCTLTGALTVTTHVRDTLSIIHGPSGCCHHNVSLLHATGFETGNLPPANLVSSGLSETEVVFGGEEALRRTLLSAAEKNVRAIFVLSTCIVDTIGDDVPGVCSGEYSVPVIPIPTAGFLGGTFQNGVNNALTALAATARVPGASEPRKGVAIIGERNLEFEVEENFREVERLLGLLGLGVSARFVHAATLEDLDRIGAGQLNILRDPGLVPVGEYLKDRFGTPYLPAFPTGFSTTLAFLESVAEACGIDGSEAIGREQALQEEILSGFSGLRSRRVMFDRFFADPGSLGAAGEVAALLGLEVGDSPACISLPAAMGTGTYGLKRLLHRWRRALRA